MQSLLSTFGLPIVGIALAIAIASLVMMMVRNWRKCAPNEALVLSGRRHKIKDDDGKIVGERGYRLIVGGAAFQFPILEKLDRIGLETFQVAFSVSDAPNTDGVEMDVEAYANLRVSSEPNILGAAVERLLGKTPQEIIELCRNTLEGQLRMIVGTLTIEQMVRDREMIAGKVLEVAQTELEKLGIKLDNFVIKGIADKVGYIEALGKRKTAEVKRDAIIGEAEATREATIRSTTAVREGEQKKLENEQLVALAARDLAVKQAGYKAETDTAQAKAALAGAMQTAEVEKDLKVKQAQVEAADQEARIKVAEQNAARREKELIAEKIKPAEAEKTSVIIRADGEKQALVLKAQGESEAKKVAAEAEKIQLTAHGEGEGASQKAILMAKAEGEAAQVEKKMLAEATGTAKMAEALGAMTDKAQLIIILDRLPKLLEEGGEALEKVATAIFSSVAAPLGNIDNLNIVDIGGNGKGLNQLSTLVPKTVMETMAAFKGAGIDFTPILEKFGINAEVLSQLLAGLNAHKAHQGGGASETTVEA
jgi:flotillin